METSLQTTSTTQLIRSSEVRRSDLQLFVGQQIAKAILVAGYNSINPDAKKVMLEEVPKDIQTNKRFRLLELPEIEKAFYDGVRCVYGEYFGITTVTINKWLNAYIDSGEHNKYLANKPVPENQKQLAQKTELTQQEVDDIMRKGIIKCYEDYKQTGVVLDYGSPKINWLLDKGIVKPSKEDRDMYKLQAREALEQQAADKLQSIHRNERTEGKKEVEELITMLDTDTKIQSLAKNMCLRDWFEEMEATEQNILSIIS